eukprot:GFYU01034618.1.p1 GENE.GFYU01034618.1~~GFYU01034618.1.p1  ORF type:complete len:237 (+),score=1.27 GFYU01034618.1:169-879(+)
MEPPHCANAECTLRATTLRRCAQCKVAIYCSRPCQKQDWKTHKLTCSNLEESAYFSQGEWISIVPGTKRFITTFNVLTCVGLFVYHEKLSFGAHIDAETFYNDSRRYTEVLKLIDRLYHGIPRKELQVKVLGCHSRGYPGFHDIGDALVRALDKGGYLNVDLSLFKFFDGFTTEEWHTDSRLVDAKSYNLGYYFGRVSMDVTDGNVVWETPPGGPLLGGRSVRIGRLLVRSNGVPG